MRKSPAGFIAILTAFAMLAGCASAPDDKSTALKDSLAGKLEEKKASGQALQNAEDGDGSESQKAGNRFSLASEADIQAFLEGEWTLFDRSTGDDLGVMKLNKDGSFDYKRIADGAQGKGHLTFSRLDAKEDEEPDMFTLEFDYIDDFVPEGDYYFDEFGKAESTGGTFHIGCFEDEDYLYLSEIGNGDSALSMFVLNADGDPGEMGEWMTNWLFYRSNGGRSEADLPDDDTFYAWAWEIDDNGEGVWLQPMDIHEFETSDEYSDRRFTGAWFGETEDLGVAYVPFSSDADTSGVLLKHEWDSGYPLMMCEAKLNEDGELASISNIDTAIYGVYDMGSLKPDISYKDTTFTINRVDIDVREAAPAVNAIMDCKQVGDWIIIEGHVNPHMSVYEFYNINDGAGSYFQYEIQGTNLTWRGDDLSTAVYAQYNEIYDFWGHYIGSVYEGEIYDLSIVDDTTVEATCFAVDETGREKEFTEKFEYEPCDGAVLSYYEYMLGNDRQWREFIANAPANAAAFVIVDPPEKILERMPFSTEYESGALDKVAVISLMEDQKVYVEPLEPDMSQGTGKSDVQEMIRGRAAVFDVTVPEGMPVDEIVVSTPGLGDVNWDVITLSGRIPMMGTFLVAGD